MFTKFRFFRPLFSVVICTFAAIFAWLTDRGNGDEPEPAAARRKIVFIAGADSHGPGEHEYRAGCRLLADHLNRSGLPVNAVVVTDGWPEDESVLDDAAAVIFYTDGADAHPAVSHLKTLKKMSAAGVGIGCLHWSVEVAAGENGDAFLGMLGGYFEMDWSVNPVWKASLKVADHEVTRGISDFPMRDEFYYHMRFREDLDGVTPILTDLPPAESLDRPDGERSGNPAVRKAVLERKEPQTILWISGPTGKGAGRGFGFTGGHFHENWRNDDYRRVVLNSILWIARVPVPEKGIASPHPTDEEMAANIKAVKTVR